MTRVLPRFLALLTAAALLAPLPSYAGDDGSLDWLDGRDGDARRVTEVQIHGRAFGHGHGLSQYGALGRANDGQTYREILDFYYPGTTLGRAGGQVRVLVTDDTSRDVVVLDRPGLTVKALASGKQWTPRVDATRWKINSAPEGRSVISYRTGRWHAWRTVTGDAQFTAQGQPVTLVTPEGRVDYRGALRSATPAGEETRDRDTVNVVPLEGYLKGVVPKEVPAEWPADTVRSQAVAARTYAAYERADVPAGRHFDVWDTTRSQVYGGHTAEHPLSNAAVAATAGEVVEHEGELAFAQFSASNGGWTAQGQVHGEDVPYLPAKEDKLDKAYQEPDGDWTATFTPEQITRHWEGLGDLQSVTVDERDVNDKWVLRVTVTGSESSVTVSGETFRSFLGLKSHFFDDPVVR